MITEDRAEKAVEYLRDSAENYGAYRGRMAYCESNLRRVKSLLMLAKTGPMWEREAEAYAAEEYNQAMKDLSDATADYETMRALREAAAFTVEVWRSQNSTRRQGNV